MRSLAHPEPNPNIPPLRPGDTVRVHNRIVEGDRERTQIFQGVVIRLRGSGADSTFTVRRIASHGVGVERTFSMQSPRLEKVEVVRHGHARRARLYYLRERRGKAARLRERRQAAPAPAASAPAAEAVPEEQAESSE